MPYPDKEDLKHQGISNIFARIESSTDLRYRLPQLINMGYHLWNFQTIFLMYTFVDILTTYLWRSRGLD